MRPPTIDHSLILISTYTLGPTSKDWLSAQARAVVLVLAMQDKQQDGITGKGRQKDVPCLAHNLKGSSECLHTDSQHSLSQRWARTGRAWLQCVYSKSQGRTDAQKPIRKFFFAVAEVLLYVHRNCSFIRGREPRTSTSTFTQILSSVFCFCF